MKILNLIINGNEYAVVAGEHDTLARVIREKVSLTGTKMGCEQEIGRASCRERV